MNPLRHDGVIFDEAKAVLRDRFALTREETSSPGERRFVALGLRAEGHLLIVVWTLRGERIRFVAGWKAAQPQRRRRE